MKGWVTVYCRACARTLDPAVVCTVAVYILAIAIATHGLYILDAKGVECQLVCHRQG